MTIFRAIASMTLVWAAGQGAAPALAQSPLVPAPPPGPPVVYRLADRSLHSAPEAAAGEVVLYANTCARPWYFGQCGEEAHVDEGRLPSTTSVPVAGSLDRYAITGFEISYCTFELDPTAGGPGVHALIRFWDFYDPCADPATQPPPVAEFDLTGLPGGPFPGAQTCHVVLVDLTGSGQEFEMAADGDGVFNGIPSLDSFAFSFQMLDPVSGVAGPSLAGHHRLCAEGHGTHWLDPGVPGTGLGNLDQYRLVDTGGPLHCAWFPGCYDHPAVFDGVYLKLVGDPATPPPQPGTAYCFGQGCPCGNDDLEAGCVNLTGGGALLTGHGTSSAGADDLAFHATSMPPDTHCIFFMGSAPGSLPFDNGILCIAPGVGLQRFGPPIHTGSQGTAVLGPGVVGLSQSFPPGAQIQAGSTWRFQCWYRDGTGPCGAGTNLSNAFAVTFGL